MTESEAIEELKYDCNELGKAIPCDTSWGSSFENAYRMAIQALEKQIEMKKYCDENGCTNCPYHNTSLKDNRCMNDFIIDKE